MCRVLYSWPALFPVAFSYRGRTVASNDYHHPVLSIISYCRKAFKAKDGYGKKSEE